MRRKDREVTNALELAAIIRDCDCCRLGIRDGDGVYVVPLSFGYEAIGKGVLYFHCAKEGHKLDLLAEYPEVGFEMDTRHELRGGETGCAFTFLYESVIGKGTVSRVSDRAEKKAALSRIVEQYAHRGGWTFTDAQTDDVAVLRLDVGEMTGKAHR